MNIFSNWPLANVRQMHILHTHRRCREILLRSIAIIIIIEIVSVRPQPVRFHGHGHPAATFVVDTTSRYKISDGTQRQTPSPFYLLILWGVVSDNGVVKWNKRIASLQDNCNDNSCSFIGAHAKCAQLSRLAGVNGVHKCTHKHLTGEKKKEKRMRILFFAEPLI